MKRIIVGRLAISALLIVAPLSVAGAADMAVKAPPALPPATADWSGIYIGGHVGYQWDRIGSTFDANPALAVPTVQSNTGIGGFQIGIQKQWSNIVLGIEGGLTDPFSRPLNQTPAPALGAFTHAATMDSATYWGGVRAGIAINTWMAYATGGYARAKFQWLDMTTAGAFTSQGTSWNSGPYVGGGVDYAITQNWIAGIEYRHYSFGTKDAPVTTGPVGDAKTNQPKVDSVVLRLSYKFGWIK
jgi:opacity protein-like surface antigen